MPIPEGFWEQEYERTFELVRDLFMRAAVEGASAVMAEMARIGLGVDEAEINRRIADWGLQYAPNAAAMILETTRQSIEEMVNLYPDEVDWAEIGTLVYGPYRAETIGISETTLGFSIGNLIAWSAYDNIYVEAEWVTAGDEKVCPICEEKDGTIVWSGGSLFGEYPPAHPRCRCWLQAVVHLSRSLPLLNGLFAGKLEWARMYELARLV